MEKATKLTNRAKQAIKTRKKIYNTSIELIKQKGYESVSVSQIAKKSGISIGTFYHHFESKFELLVEIFDQADKYFEENAPRIIDSDSSYIDKIMAYINLYAQLCVDEGLEKMKALYVPTNSMFKANDRLMQTLLVDLVLEAQKYGEISNEKSADDITEQFFVVARGVVFNWCLYEGESDILIDMADTVGRVVKSYKK